MHYYYEGLVVDGVSIPISIHHHFYHPRMKKQEGVRLFDATLSLLLIIFDSLILFFVVIAVTVIVIVNYDCVFMIVVVLCCVCDKVVAGLSSCILFLHSRYWLAILLLACYFAIGLLLVVGSFMRVYYYIMPPMPPMPPMPAGMPPPALSSSGESVGNTTQYNTIQYKGG